MTFWATPQLPKPEGRPHQESPFHLSFSPFAIGTSCRHCSRSAIQTSLMALAYSQRSPLALRADTAPARQSANKFALHSLTRSVHHWHFVPTLLPLGKARTSSALHSLTRHLRHSSNKSGSALAYSQRSPLALRADTAPARHSSSKFGSALAYSQRSPFTIFINCVLCHCRWYSIACRGELSCQ